MRVIHFTEGATDWLFGFRAQLARSVSLVSGDGDTHVSCLHLKPCARIIDPPATHDCALLVVHGQVLVVEDHGASINLSCGMGAVIKAADRYHLECERGAIVLTVESLEATPQGISTPQRIAGQRWPGEDLS